MTPVEVSVEILSTLWDSLWFGGSLNPILRWPLSGLPSYRVPGPALFDNLWFRCRCSPLLGLPLFCKRVEIPLPSLCSGWRRCSPILWWPLLWAGVENVRDVPCILEWDFDKNWGNGRDHEGKVQGGSVQYKQYIYVRANSEICREKVKKKKIRHIQANSSFLIQLLLCEVFFCFVCTEHKLFCHEYSISLLSCYCAVYIFIYGKPSLIIFKILKIKGGLFSIFSFYERYIPLCRRMLGSNPGMLRHLRKNIKRRDQWEWIGLWKVAINRHLVHIVVIDVVFYFNLAAILE
jgi:hypothetical protein